MKMHQFIWAGDNFHKVISGKSREIESFWTICEGRQNMNILWRASWLPRHPVILGKKADEINDREKQSEGKENIRVAIAAECRQLRDKSLICGREPMGRCPGCSGRSTSGSVRIWWAEAEKENSYTCSTTGKWGPTGLIERSPVCFWVELGLLLDEDSSQRGDTYHIFTKLLKRIWSTNSKSQDRTTPTSLGEEWEIGSF